MTESIHCKRVQGRLLEFIDHGLPALEEARDGGHLESCLDCSREREGLLSMLHAVRAAMEPDRAELAHELAVLQPRLSQAKLRPAALRLLGGRVAISIMTAAAAVLLLLALGWHRSGTIASGGAELLDSLDVAEWSFSIGDSLRSIK